MKKISSLLVAPCFVSAIICLCFGIYTNIGDFTISLTFGSFNQNVNPGFIFYILAIILILSTIYFIKLILKNETSS